MEDLIIKAGINLKAKQKLKFISSSRKDVEKKERKHKYTTSRMREVIRKIKHKYISKMRIEILLTTSKVGIFKHQLILV